MKEYVFLDKILARNSRENRTRLLGIKPQVMDEVAVDPVAPRLIAVSPINPHSLAREPNTVLPDIPHFVPSDITVTVVCVEPHPVAADAVEQVVVDGDIFGPN